MLKQMVGTQIGRGLRHADAALRALRLGRRETWCAVGAVLIAFALWQAFAPNGDLYQYRCFALAFWHGSADALGAPGCGGRLPAGPFPAFHVLPHEYPPLALLVFSLPLLSGGQVSMLVYVLAFNAIMLGCLGATAALIAHAPLGSAVSRRAEQPYLLWLAVGSTTIALVRFDAAPALLTVATLILAQRRPSWSPTFCWRWPPCSSSIPRSSSRCWRPGIGDGAAVRRPGLSCHFGPAAQRSPA